jgi:hypothetical protein
VPVTPVETPSGLITSLPSVPVITLMIFSFWLV